MDNQQGQAQCSGYYNPYFAMLQQMQGNPMFMPQPGNYNQPQSKPEPQHQAGEMVWVEGVTEVESKQLNPGSVAVFFDKNIEGRYYIRIRNDIGQYQTKVFESSEVTETNAPSVDMSQYVRREELEELIRKLGGTDNGKQSVQPATANHTIINTPADPGTAGSK